jgi:membrane protein
MANTLFSKVGELYRGFKAKNIITLAASVSFFGFLSLFPFLVLLASIASLFFERRQALEQVERLLRPLPVGVADTVIQTLRGAVNSGKIASVLSFLVLIYSSLAVFGQLQIALNKVMGTKRKGKGWVSDLKVFGFFLVTALVFLVLMLGGGTFFVLASKLGDLPLIRTFWVVEAAVFLLEVVLFSFSYRYLAYKVLPWKSVLAGGLFTTVLWEILKILFGWYVSSLNLVTALYGVIGSVFFLMLWLFYSVLIYFAGAHISVELE